MCLKLNIPRDLFKIKLQLIQDYVETTTIYFLVPA
jgi:hypothetical protein